MTVRRLLPLFAVAMGLALGFPDAAFVAGAQEGRAALVAANPGMAALQASMAARFGALRPHLDSGAVGLGRDGFVVVRLAGATADVVGLVDAENADRRRLYALVARLQGRAEWVDLVREVFAAQWVASAKPGWFYQLDDGAWRRK